MILYIVLLLCLRTSPKWNLKYISIYSQIEGILVLHKVNTKKPLLMGLPNKEIIRVVLPYLEMHKTSTSEWILNKLCNIACSKRIEPALKQKQGK